MSRYLIYGSLPEGAQIGGYRPDWLRGLDLNQRPLGYEPNELPDCSTPHLDSNNPSPQGQTTQRLLPAHVPRIQIPQAARRVERASAAARTTLFGCPT
jgi:hypothetical protein